jgi:hypothetical protein
MGHVVESTADDVEDACVAEGREELLLSPPTVAYSSARLSKSFCSASGSVPATDPKTAVMIASAIAPTPRMPRSPGMSRRFWMSIVTRV